MDASIGFSRAETPTVLSATATKLYVELDCLARVCAKGETRNVAALGPVRVYRQMLDGLRRVPQVDLPLFSPATRQTTTGRV